MPSAQPTLWDNLDLQKGYNSLRALNFAEAKAHFKIALEGTNAEEANINAAIEAIEYWHPAFSTGPGIPATEWLRLFSSFSFPAQLLPFKKALLKQSVAIVSGDGLGTAWEQLFDLLLENSEYKTAIALLNRVKNEAPSNHALSYHYGQAYYRMSNVSNSKSYYARALLLCPSEALAARVELAPVQKIIASKGIHMAYLYGHLAQLFDAVKVPESFAPINTEHEKALSLYHLFAAAEHHDNRGDIAVQMNIRRQMQLIDPMFLADYLHRNNL